ncbi:EARLY IN SHORT DAYS 4 [Hibiscus trionum]|uniref:EARLY IN SHORT DAYS 4 n=1 Tax=Hibiscus trionum TaxID=183268 RepID=A0A9W7H2S3_HIBTR|nr:EARLY IN SHORT DAYS 4 [Hibiscus trionum]
MAKNDILDVANARTVFPGKWLSDWFIDIYVYDLHLRQEPMPKKLYLPLSFQSIIIEYFTHAQKAGEMTNVIKFHSRWIEDFIPIDSSDVEQVYVSLHDAEGKHWFLLVVDVVEGHNYVLDSLGVNEVRKNIAKYLLSKAPLMYGSHAHLGRLFEDAAKFPISFLELPKQPNSDDCGMYILKYIEADKKSDWSKIIFTTQQMGVERLKILAKLVTSNHNEVDLFNPRELTIQDAKVEERNGVKRAKVADDSFQ